MTESSVVRKQREIYQKNFLIHGDSPLGTFQNDQVTQFLRFEQLIKGIKDHFTPDTTIHDIGSGVCDFYTFLRDNDIKVNYSGTEIVPDMIDIVKNKYPELEILNRDFLSEDVKDKYDFVILSGTLNLPGEVTEDNWKEFCFQMIRKMFESSKKGIALNFLTSYRTFSDPTLYYIDPKEVFDFCSTQLSRFVCIDAAYPLYEVTCTVFRREYLAEVYQHEALKKYFK